MIPDCCSVHEPDVIWITRPREWFPKIRRFGFYRMTIGRFSPEHSVRCLSVGRQTGVLADDVIVEHLRHLREELIQHTTKPIYCEANSIFAALVDLIPKAFPNSRTLYVIRDPRDWVRSFMNMKNFVVRAVGHP